MIGFHPTLHSDELLWSVLARSSDAGGDIVRWQIRDRRKLLNLRAPSQITMLCTGDDNQLRSAEHLASEHTIYPYFANISNTFRDELIHHSLDGSAISARKKINSLVGQLTYQNYVVFCPDCNENSNAELGYIFLRREHYLPGVFTCPHHGMMLRISETVSSRDLTLEGIGKKYREALPEGLDRNMAMYLSIEAQKILATQPQAADFDIKAACVDLGWISENGTLISNRLLEAWSAQFSDDLLRTLGFRFHMDRQQLKKVVLGAALNTLPVHPLLGTLLKKLILSSTTDDPQFDLFGDRRGDYMHCPNPLCELKQAVRLGHDQTCPNCSYHWWVSRKRAVVGKVIDRGSVWKHGLKRLLDEQTPLKKIAKALKASPENIKREALELGYAAIWKKPKQRHDYSTSVLDIKAARSEWQKVIKSNTELSRKELRAVTPALWKWLYRNDRGWLEQNQPPARAAGRSISNNQSLFEEKTP